MAKLYQVIIDENGADVPDTYSKTEIDDMIAGITGVTFEVASTLPATGNAGTIYLIGNDVAGYQMWVYVGGAWKNISSQVDLSNYYTKAQSDSKFYSKNGGTVNGNVIVNHSDGTSSNYIQLGGASSTGSSYQDWFRDGYRTRVWPLPLTENRMVRIQDKDGTLALLSDINNIEIGSVQTGYLPDSTGNTFGSGWNTITGSLSLPAGLYFINAWFEENISTSTTVIGGRMKTSSGTVVGRPVASQVAKTSSYWASVELSVFIKPTTTMSYVFDFYSSSNTAGSKRVYYRYIKIG